MSFIKSYWSTFKISFGFEGHITTQENNLCAKNAPDHSKIVTPSQHATQYANNNTRSHNINCMEHRQVSAQPAWLTDDKAVWSRTALWALAITADVCGGSTGGRTDFIQQDSPSALHSGSLTIRSKVIRQKLSKKFPTF